MIFPEERVHSLTDPWLRHMGEGGPPQSSKIPITERAKPKKSSRFSPRQPHSQALWLHGPLMVVNGVVAVGWGTGEGSAFGFHKAKKFVIQCHLLERTERPLCSNLLD